MMWQAIEESEVPSPIAVGLGRSPVLHDGRWYARSSGRAVRWGFGDAAGDMAAFNLMISNGDTALANADFSNAVTEYQSAGQAGAVTIGPEIDAQTSNASQPQTQQAWTLNGQLAQINAGTATQADATNAQNLAHQMQSLYNQALQATPATPSSASNLDVAAGTLLQRLQTGGCTTSSFSECKAFQDAWNAAGGVPSLDPDGKYGSQTSASLQAALNVGPNQPPQTAPASCFAATNVTPPQAPAKPAAPVVVATTPTNWTPWLIAGGVAVLGVGGYALYRYKKKHGHMPGSRRAA